MIRKLTILAVIVAALTSISCNNGVAPKNSVAKPGANAIVKREVTPIADAEVAVIDTEFGPIKIELYSNVAPKMVARFKELANAGYYNGLAWHRINNDVIQAGNSDTRGGASTIPGKPEGNSGKPNVDAEFSDLKYETGTVGAARLGNDVNSQNSQFFITLKRQSGFDENYTIFGKVVEGLNNVMLLSGVPRDGERPNPPRIIKTVTIQPK